MKLIVQHFPCSSRAEFFSKNSFPKMDNLMTYTKFCKFYPGNFISFWSFHSVVYILEMWKLSREIPNHLLQFLVEWKVPIILVSLISIIMTKTKSYQVDRTTHCFLSKSCFQHLPVFNLPVLLALGMSSNWVCPWQQGAGGGTV